jgi:RNA polymerase sigma-70 factor (ECF subfamily)
MEGLSVARQLRDLYPRVLAKTLAFTRRLVDAEDAVQDAIERALETWPRTGAPDSPEGWLVTVAANCHRDRIRRDRRHDRHVAALAGLAEMSPWVQGAIAAPEIARGWKDDLLRLVFACCHPALETGESAALALATVLGLSSDEIARAFAIAPRAMDQRLTRARRRLREEGDDEAPATAGARPRLGAVLATIHLLFNEGYWSTRDDEPIRGDLCRLAIGLARSLHEAFPEEPEVGGLLALLILHEARRPARTDGAGGPVPLPQQDRSRWDGAAIDEGTALVDAALRVGRPGPFQIEAAISAVHCRARAADQTDWTEIAALYDLLERTRPSPAVRVNRALAVGQAQGAAAGLALLDEVDDGAPYLHLVRGALLEELGDLEGAARSLRDAMAVARNAHEARQIEARVLRIEARTRS